MVRPHAIIKIMSSLSILLVFLGILLIILGLDISGRIGPLGKLPGDIMIQKGEWIFYFPIGTALLISVLFSMLFAIFNKLFR